MPDLPAKQRGLWKRLLLGAVLVVVASASATAVGAFHEVDRVVNALRTQPGLNLGADLAEANPGAPQTVMIIGSDKRAPTARDAKVGKGARSDTLMLVRLDPTRGATALMSLPRDLKVRIPGHGTDKLNAAYAVGGPQLTLETVKRLTGLRINHVVSIDFRGFREAVDAIGCVYADVDRRYFNDNSGPDQYATIDVKAGYQRLCGEKALEYVRYRHTDNDLVRSARQQDFLRQVKQQLRVGQLISDRERLVSIFGRYTRSDIRSRAAVLSLVKLAVFSAGRPIREVHFEGEIGPSYVTASSRRVQKLTQQFLGVEATAGPRGEPPSKPGQPSPELPPTGAPRHRRGPKLDDVRAAGRAQARQAVGAGAGLPVFYPTRAVRGADFADAPRAYPIDSPDGVHHAAYRMVVRRGQLGEYYGLQGTNWTDPPILDRPSEVRQVGGRRLELFYDGDRLRLVAWHTPGAVYWVSNTLLETLSNAEMVAIAASARAL